MIQMEKLTRHGVRDLSHLGSKCRKAEKLRAEADELEARAKGRLFLAAEWQKSADELREVARKLQIEAADKRAEAETLCPH